MRNKKNRGNSTFGIIVALILVSILAGFLASNSAETAVSHMVDVQAELERDPESVMDMIEVSQRMRQAQENDGNGLVWVIVFVVVVGGISVLLHNATPVTKNAVAFIRAVKKRGQYNSQPQINYVKPVNYLHSGEDGRFLTSGNDSTEGGDTSWIE